MGARIQPNSPTDHPDDVVWQVFDAFAYATGDIVIGTNPVDSTVASVAAVENALKDVVDTFGLQDTIPWCVLSHIDVQAEVAERYPGTVATMFQSLAGTDDCNKIFDVTIPKIMKYAQSKQGERYGLYFETGQGSEFTNGAANGVDMMVLESRKYGFSRAVGAELAKVQPRGAWLHVNDVAGFIGPEVFKSREQLVRCCLEDIVMGKLHGLPIGLDVCSTLHMTVSLEDLDWCQEQVMPANPVYLIALPTKNDPMLGYLTTSFQDHVRLRERFGFKVDDAMWSFYQRLGIVDQNGKYTEHYGDPLWVYYQYRLAKNDRRPKDAIYAEGQAKMREVEARGVDLATGHGEQIWDLNPQLAAKVNELYDDAKVSLWAELTPEFVASIPNVLPVRTLSSDRNDYIAHPSTGETLSPESHGRTGRIAGIVGQRPAQGPDRHLRRPERQGHHGPGASCAVPGGDAAPACGRRRADERRRTSWSPAGGCGPGIGSARRCSQGRIPTASGASSTSSASGRAPCTTPIRSTSRSRRARSGRRRRSITTSRSS